MIKKTGVTHLCIRTKLIMPMFANMNQEERSLLQSLRQEKPRAFDQLFQQYASFLIQHARYLLKDEAEAQDQVQGLFIDFWEKRRFNQVHSSLRYYLLRSIHTRCLIHLQKSKVSDKRFRQYLQTRQYQLHTDLLEEKESAHKVRQLLSILPHQRQEVFGLIHMEDKKYREAAGILHISTNSVKTHLKLAVKQLRQELARAG